ncbi:MAG: PAS domain-containing protein [Emcibacteraceae bacterium]|nr:PAS domain-containing protein [Emcibacteraceae bacterium]
MSNFIANQSECDQLIAKTSSVFISDSQKTLLKDWIQLYNSDTRRLPARADFPPPHYHVHMPSAVIFEVMDEPLDFKYRLFGTIVANHSTADFTGKLLSSLPGKGPDSGIWKMLNSTKENKIPLFREVPYVGPHSDFIRSTVLFLPMASDHKNPDRIFLIANFISKNLLSENGEF